MPLAHALHAAGQRLGIANPGVRIEDPGALTLQLPASGIWGRLTVERAITRYQTPSPALADLSFGLETAPYTAPMGPIPVEFGEITGAELWLGASDGSELSAHLDATQARQLLALWTATNGSQPQEITKFPALSGEKLLAAA